MYGGNASAVEHLYEQYLEDPGSVPPGWRDYIEAMGDPDTEVVHTKVREALLAEAAAVRRSGVVTRQRSGKPSTAG